MRDMVTARTRTIRRAIETLGSEQALADALGVQAAEVANWLSKVTPPDDAYFAALDIVANGPLGSKAARMRTD
jgi:DNA-binding transcriptional regulator YiaG